MNLWIIIGALGLIVLTATLALRAHPDRCHHSFAAGYRAGFQQANRLKGKR